MVHTADRETADEIGDQEQNDMRKHDPRAAAQIARGRCSKREQTKQRRGTKRNERCKVDCASTRENRNEKGLDQFEFRGAAFADDLRKWLEKRRPDRSGSDFFQA